MLLQDESVFHYILVKDVSRLVYGRTKSHVKNYACLSCFRSFSSQRVLDNHTELCLNFNSQQINFPDPDDPQACTLSFRAHNTEHVHAFYLVADMESFLVPNENVDDATVIDTHQVSGFCLQRVTQYDEY